MKSLIAGALAAASFAASFAASVETQVEQRVVHPVQNHVIEPIKDKLVVPVKDVVQPAVYDVFGTNLLPTATDKADKLVVVSSTKCPPCRRLESEVLEPLKKLGYNIQVVMVPDYKGDESIDRTPTLLFYNGEKMIKRMIGYQTKDAITKVLQKPTVELSND